MINKNLIYPSIGLVAAAMAAFQIYIIRFFSLVHLGTYLYIPISVAILGIGLAGMLISFMEDRIRKNPDMFLGVSLVLTIFFTSTVFLGLKHIEFNALALFSVSNVFGELIKILIFYILLTIPFFCAGFFVVLSFYTEKNPLHTIYLFNLVGSALGSILFLIGLIILPIKFLIFISVILLSISAFLIISKEKSSKIILIIFTFISLAAPLLDLEIRPMPYKDISRAYSEGGKLLNSSESIFGDLKVIENPNQKFTGGISSIYQGKQPEFKSIYIDGNKVSEFVKGENQDFLNYSPFSLAFALKNTPSALILESGGSLAVMAAINYNAKKIDAVEKNYQIINLLKEDFSEYTSGIYHNKNVTFYRSETRPFLASLNKKYDLVFINGQSIQEGSFKEEPNFLLTREGLEKSYQALNKDGILVIKLFLQTPPRIELKIIHTIKAFLSKGKGLFAFKTPDSFVIFARQGEFSAQEIKALQEKAQALSFGVVYPSSSQQDIYTKNINAILQGNKDILNEYQFSLSPLTDTQPYLYYSQKVKNLFDFKSTPPEEFSYTIIWMAFLLTLLIGATTMYLPILLKKDYGKKIHISKVVMYFGGIGAGFILVQMVFIQKFNLLFASPVFSVALALGSTFLFGGVGTYIGSLFKKRVLGLFIALPSIIILILLYILAFDWVLDGISSLKLIYRLMFGFFAIAPLAFFMGMPFALGLEWIKYFEPKVIPWCWSINAAFSVVAAALSLILGVGIGLNWTLFIGAVFYAIALNSFVWMDYHYQQTSYLYRRYKV